MPAMEKLLINTYSHRDKALFTVHSVAQRGKEQTSRENTQDVSIHILCLSPFLLTDVPVDAFTYI